jgi:flagellar L-ring protein precursor FlgH
MLGLVASATLFCVTAGAKASDLFKPGSWTAMASDRLATRVGDSLTVLIYENAQAQNTSQNSRQASASLSGQIGSNAVVHSGQISGSGGYSGTDQTGRAGQMVAQISVVVDEVLPNGDLHVAGEQVLNINGDHTRIRLKGRVRREDITSANTVQSSQLADVSIDYGGAGFGAGKKGPGLARRVLGWFGLH